MANIPVERTKTGVPPWLWLVGLLLLALLAWFLISALSDDDEAAFVAEDPVEVVEPVPAPVVVADPVVTSALDLSNVYVTRVTGDKTFYVSASEGDTSNETLVILDESSSPGTPGIEGQVDINAGQRLSLSSGRLEAFGDADASTMGLDAADASAVTATTDVVRIDGAAVEVLDAPMGADAVEVGT